MKVATPTRTIIAPRERCASPHPPPSLSVSFFSIPIVLNTTIRQFTENPMRPKPTMSVETTMPLLPSDRDSLFPSLTITLRPLPIVLQLGGREGDRERSAAASLRSSIGRDRDAILAFGRCGHFGQAFL